MSELSDFTVNRIGVNPPLIAKAGERNLKNSRVGGTEKHEVINENTKIVHCFSLKIWVF